MRFDGFARNDFLINIFWKFLIEVNTLHISVSKTTLNLEKGESNMKSLKYKF